MVKGLYTAYTGMIDEQNRLDVLSNNLANADTTAYKKEGTTNHSFADTLAIKINDTSAYNLPKKLGAISLGVRIGENYTDYGQGNFRVTNNKYDVALNGDGFFAVSYTNKNNQTSAKYTRDGAFTVNTDGYLVTKDGDYVLNQNGAATGNPGQANYIKIDPNQDCKIDEFGNIMQNDQVVAKIGVVDIADKNYIKKFGENLYDLANGAQVIPSKAKVVQGSLETSNVNVVSEMVEMITMTRAYESNQKIIQTIDETLQKAANQVGKV